MKAVSRVLYVAIAAIGLLAYATVGLAQEKGPAGTEATKATTPQESSSSQVTYLGVAIERLHPVFALHFPNILAKEQGLLVMDVTPKSPAAEAGLKTHDILLGFNDQKLASPEQLSKLVASGKPGQEVSLGILREGKQETIKVKLGSRALEQPKVAAGQPLMRRAFRMPGMLRQEMREKGAPGIEPVSWANFESLTLKKLADDRFSVEIAYRDNKEKTEIRKFEGTRDEIRTAVDNAKDLPLPERHHVLASLDLRGMVGPPSRTEY